MKIGAMNNPQCSIESEMTWIADFGFDFIDLTLEPPQAASWAVNIDHLRHRLEELDLEAVGHTAFYLPFASPFESLRRAAVQEVKKCLPIMRDFGIKWVNLHPDRPAPMHDMKFTVQRNIESFSELMEEASRLGLGLMVENVPGGFNSLTELSQLLDPLPDLGLHLDLGHTNLNGPVNTAYEIIDAYAGRLRHIHLHDNRGDADLHLPLGTGTVDYRSLVATLCRAGYNETITLEVFTPDHEHLRYSKRLLAEAWAKYENQPLAEHRLRQAQPEKPKEFETPIGRP